MSTGAADSPKATVRIAVDTMGGDYAPHEIVSGALKATHLNPIELVLVGDRGVLERELEQYGTGELSIKIVPSDGSSGKRVGAIRHGGVVN
jgi:fatty acid/phospholipid biosynthesis enzyme